MTRRCECSLFTIVATGVATGVAAGMVLGAGCGSAPRPEPAKTESPPAAAAPAPAPAPAPAAPAPPAPPSDLPSATRDNPLRPQAHVGQSIRDDAGPPVPGKPDLAALKLPPGF